MNSIARLLAYARYHRRQVLLANVAAPLTQKSP